MRYAEVGAESLERITGDHELGPLLYTSGESGVLVQTCGEGGQNAPCYKAQIGLRHPLSNVSRLVYLVHPSDEDGTYDIVMRPKTGYVGSEENGSPLARQLKGAREARRAPEDDVPEILAGFAREILGNYGFFKVEPGDVQTWRSRDLGERMGSRINMLKYPEGSAGVLPYEGVRPHESGISIGQGTLIRPVYTAQGLDDVYEMFEVASGRFQGDFMKRRWVRLDPYDVGVSLIGNNRKGPEPCGYVALGNATTLPFSMAVDRAGGLSGYIHNMGELADNWRGPTERGGAGPEHVRQLTETMMCMGAHMIGFASAQAGLPVDGDRNLSGQIMEMAERTLGGEDFAKFSAPERPMIGLQDVA